MQNGQLLFVIFFIIAITLFSFFREKKKKPLVIFFGDPFQNKADFIAQMQMIAGYAFDFTWENIQGSGTIFFDNVEKIIQSKKPKVIFLSLDFNTSILAGADYSTLNLQPFENFCSKHLLSLQEKGVHLAVILNRSAIPHFEKVEMILKEFPLPAIHLEEIAEPAKTDENKNLLSKKEIEKLASKINASLDTIASFFL